MIWEIGAGFIGMFVAVYLFGRHTDKYYTQPRIKKWLDEEMAKPKWRVLIITSTGCELLTAPFEPYYDHTDFYPDWERTSKMCAEERALEIIEDGYVKIGDIFYGDLYTVEAVCR